MGKKQLYGKFKPQTKGENARVMTSTKLRRENLKRKNVSLSLAAQINAKKNHLKRTLLIRRRIASVGYVETEIKLQLSWWVNATKSS